MGGDGGEETQGRSGCGDQEGERRHRRDINEKTLAGTNPSARGSTPASGKVPVGWFFRVPLAECHRGG